jgi:hypothetical protein
MVLHTAYPWAGKLITYAKRKVTRQKKRDEKDEKGMELNGSWAR